MMARLAWALMAALAMADIVGRVVAQEAPVPNRTLSVCETELLDVRGALVDAQEQLALWQARAIQAEAKLARQEIERRRQVLTPKSQ